MDAHQGCNALLSVEKEVDPEGIEPIYITVNGVILYEGQPFWRYDRVFGRGYSLVDMPEDNTQLVDYRVATFGNVVKADLIPIKWFSVDEEEDDSFVLVRRRSAEHVMIDDVVFLGGATWLVLQVKQHRSTVTLKICPVVCLVPGVSPRSHDLTDVPDSFEFCESRGYPFGQLLRVKVFSSN
jgi:hypothetical protein